MTLNTITQPSFEAGLELANRANVSFNAMQANIGQIAVVRDYMEASELPADVRDTLELGVEKLEARRDFESTLFDMFNDKADQYFSGLRAAKTAKLG